MKAPYLVAAFVCNNVLVEEESRIPTFVQVIDDITLHPPTPWPLGDRVPLAQWLVVTFKGVGAAEVRPLLKIAAYGPIGKAKKTFLEYPLPKCEDGEYYGHTLAVRLHVWWEGEGIYRFNVVLDRRLCTRVLLRVRIGEPEFVGEGKP